MSIEPKRNVYDRQAQTWALYAETMATAGRAALAFADAISAYLRGGMSCYRGFDEACRAADAYGIAVDAASEWHFGCIQRHGSGIIINCQADELVALMRELRGTAVPVTLRNNNRTLASYRYADDGIAGFYRQEVRSMARFGSPRRDPRVVGTWASHSAA